MSEENQLHKRVNPGGSSSAGKTGAAAVHNKLIEKGKALLDDIGSPVCHVKQATWTTANFGRYGWVVELSTFDTAGYLSSPLNELLRERATSIYNTKNNLVEWTHAKDVKIDQDIPKIYRVTHGYFRNSFCVGVIFGMDLRSPGYEAEKASPPIKAAGLVPFRRWSDITFLSYKQYCKRQARGKPEEQAEVEKCLKGLKFVVMNGKLCFTGIKGLAYC